MKWAMNHLLALATVLAFASSALAQFRPDTAAHEGGAGGVPMVRPSRWEDVPVYRHEGLSRARFAVALSGVGIYDLAFYETLKKPWWSGEKSGFHVINDWWGNYAMEVDKCAHAYAGQSMALIAAQSYQWSGMTRRQGLFWGGVTGVAMLAQVEVLDGYTRRYGFSTGDFAANLVGAFYPLAQEVWDPLRLVTLKMSWHPRRFEDTGYDHNPSPPNLLEDYDRMTYWLALDINGMLPAGVQRYWPDWLGVALGYGVKNAFSQCEGDRMRECYVALDLDPTRANLGNGWLARALAPLHYIHLPAPAIRFRGDGTKSFALYF